MINQGNIHDAAILGLFYELKEEKLFIQTELSSGAKILMEFNHVFGWDLSPFDEQNILFDFHEYDKTNLPDWIVEDFNVPEEYIGLIKTEEAKLFYLDASNGLGGYVIAKSLTLIKNKSLGISDQLT